MSDCGCLYFPPDHRLPAKYGLGAAALRYAALGYAVIPLARGGKRPHAMLGSVGGVHLASKDPTQIAEWWSYDLLANIGVACGSVNRLVVVDLDVKGGVNGRESFAHFLLNMPFPHDAPWLATPSGGRHLWLRMSGDVPERPGILPGVDVKGDGGLVVAPPSRQLVTPIIRSAERGLGQVPVPYEWASGCPHALPGVPAWFPGWLASASPAPRAVPQPTSGAGVPLDETVEQYVKNGVPGGSRNREIYRVACGLYRRHGTDSAGSAAVLETIRDIYEVTDKTDFTWREVLTCAESARRFIESSRAREDARNAEFLAWLERRPYRR